MPKRLRALPLLFLLVPMVLRAQIPTQCLEIESILVDACIDLTLCPGGAEGMNEMVRFRTGPVDIALSELEADWPNNSWNGLVQDANTATLTAELNATIQGCGWLWEPPGGVIPAGSGVILVTSTQMCTAANSFANLSDTLYIVFQAPGNTSGHFANHNNGGTISPTPVGAVSLRTLVLTYLPTACSDTAVYDRSLLVNNLGTYGGSSAENDGATALFTWPGAPVVTYVNYGCQAPFVPTLVSVEDAVGSICNGAGSVQLTGSALGTDIIGVQWQGGTGTFNPPDALSTEYTAGAGDTGPVVVQLCAIGSCGAPICIDYTLPGGSAPTILITPDGPTALCPGQSVTLAASGADDYTWSPGGETTSSITVTQPGTYSVDGTNACGAGSAQIDITLANGPAVVITPDGPTALCPGQSVTLTASGADSYVWSPGGETTTSITATQPGTYSVDGSNACGTGSAQIDITLANGPSVVITPDGPTSLCPGQSVTLTASGADSYLWSPNGETATSITVTQPGTYGVVGTNACGTGNAQVDITLANGPAVVITPDGPTDLCPGQSVTLTASGADSYVWSTQETSASITVDQAGTYSVTGTNSCGTGSAQIDVAVVDVSAAFTANPGNGAAPLDVSFANASTPSSASMLWQFGDGSSSTAFEPAHTYDADGVYTVTLTVTEQGCVATATGTIVVGANDAGPSAIEVPNVFSPNNDGRNDQFRLTSTGIDRIEVTIFNRYGEEVARLSRARQAWDGRTFAGEQCSDGTYFYIVEATGYDGVQHSLKGTVTLLR